MTLSFREFVQSPGQNAVAPSVVQQDIQQNQAYKKPLTPVQTQNEKNKDPAFDPKEWGKGGKVDVLRPFRDLTLKLNKKDPQSPNVQNPAALHLKRMQTHLDKSLANTAQGFMKWNMDNQAKKNQSQQKQSQSIAPNNM